MTFAWNCPKHFSQTNHSHHYHHLFTWQEYLSKEKISQQHCKYFCIFGNLSRMIQSWQLHLNHDAFDELVPTQSTLGWNNINFHWNFVDESLETLEKRCNACPRLPKERYAISLLELRLPTGLALATGYCIKRWLWLQSHCNCFSFPTASSLTQADLYGGLQITVYYADCWFQKLIGHEHLGK